MSDISVNSGLKNLGKEFTKKGFGNIGKALARIAGGVIKRHPIGGVLDDIGVLDAVGDLLGIEKHEDLGNQASIETLESMSAEQLQHVAKIKEVEANLIMSEIEERNTIEREESARIESVNATMRAEVLGNPDAGSWRPLWGRWTCYNFFPVVWLLLALIGFCIVTGETELLSYFPEIITGVAFLFGLPAAILGVASWKRGVEKIELAKQAEN